MLWYLGFRRRLRGVGATIRGHENAGCLHIPVMVVSHQSHFNDAAPGLNPAGPTIHVRKVVEYTHGGNGLRRAPILIKDAVLNAAQKRVVVSSSSAETIPLLPAHFSSPWSRVIFGTKGYGREKEQRRPPRDHYLPARP